MRLRVTEQVARRWLSPTARVSSRDVQPANVLFDEDGNAYLSDFGIAKDRDRRGHGGRDAREFAYPCRPRKRGGTTDARADIYSLGLVLLRVPRGRERVRRRPPDDSGRTAHDPSLSELRPPDLPGARPGDRQGGGPEPASDPDTLAFVAALHEALGRPPRWPARTGAEVRNPYKGLHPFLEADARLLRSRGRSTSSSSA